MNVLIPPRQCEKMTLNYTDSYAITSVMTITCFFGLYHAPEDVPRNMGFGNLVALGVID